MQGVIYQVLHLHHKTNLVLRRVKGDFLFDLFVMLRDFKFAFKTIKTHKKSPVHKSS